MESGWCMYPCEVGGGRRRRREEGGGEEGRGEDGMAGRQRKQEPHLGRGEQEPHLGSGE